MRNIRNPLMTLSVTLTAILAVTILFYPEELMQFVSRAIPLAQQMQPYMVKVALFTTVQVTILGLGLRTFGRLSHSGELWRAWDQTPRQIIPIAIGTQVIRERR